MFRLAYHHGSGLLLPDNKENLEAAKQHLVIICDVHNCSLQTNLVAEQQRMLFAMLAMRYMQQWLQALHMPCKALQFYYACDMLQVVLATRDKSVRVCRPHWIALPSCSQPQPLEF